MTFKTIFLASVVALGATSFAAAQSASTLGAGGSSSTPSSSSAVGGTGGSAAGGTSDRSMSKVHGNGNNLHGMSKERAQNKGTWSDSKTHTKIHKGEVTSRTKSMAHEPGGPPVKSTTGLSTGK